MEKSWKEIWRYSFNMDDEKLESLFIHPAKKFQVRMLYIRGMF